MTIEWQTGEPLIHGEHATFHGAIEELYKRVETIEEKLWPKEDGSGTDKYGTGNWTDYGDGTDYPSADFAKDVPAGDCVETHEDPSVHIG